MADDFNDGDLADLNNDTPAASEVPSIPAEVTDKFDEVFGKADAEDLAEAGLDNTKTPVVSDEQKAEASRRRKAIEKEQQDELVEEGLVSEDDPDGENAHNETPAETKDEEEPATEVEAEASQVEVNLDPNHRFAANELGWSDEKINAFMIANPELATETFEKLAETYTNLSRQLIANPGTQVALGSQVQQVTPAQPASPTSNLDKFYADLSSFAENNGEEIVERFLKPLKSEVLDPLRKMMAEAEVGKQEGLKTEARTTFGELRKKFPEVYGVEGKPLNEEQKNANSFLGQFADQIREASRMQGNELSVKEALNRAHLIVTSDRREKEVRKQITEQVQKRSKAITARPTQRRNPAAVGVKSEATAAEAYTRKAAELGIEV